MLDQQLSLVLKRLLEENCKPPFYCTIVSKNGGMMFGRYTLADGEEGLDFELINQTSSPEGMFGLPIYIMFIDSEGQVAHVKIKTSELFDFKLN